jgi:N-methylhydantoinase A
MEAGIAERSIVYDFAADMRYFGQQTEVTVTLGGDPRFEQDPSELRARFDDAYEALYGVRLDDMDVEVVSWRAAAHGGEAERNISITLRETAGKPKATRNVYVNGRSMAVAVYDRAALAAEQRIDGPVIIEERETTLFILAGWSVTVQQDGSVVATRRARGES